MRVWVAQVGIVFKAFDTEAQARHWVQVEFGYDALPKAQFWQM